jgi:transposase
LREFFPAALEAWPDLDAPDALELPGRAPGPGAADGLSRPRIQQLLRAPGLRQPAPVESAYAAIVVAQVALIRALNEQIAGLGEVVAAHFGRHPDADIYISHPGLGVILGARVLAEFGDDPGRFTDARARKNYAGTAPITRASGTRKVVRARYARNRRLADAL